MNEKINIAFFFHDSDYYSGGTRSLLDIIDNYKSNLQINVTAVFPTNKGTAIDYLKRNNIDIVYSHYYQTRYDLSESKMQFLIKLPNRIFRLILSYLYVNLITSKVLLSKEIDCIYSNTSFILAGIWAKKRIKKPLICHYREFGEEDHKIGFYLGRNYFYKISNRFPNYILVISHSLQKKYVNNIESNKLVMIYDDVSSRYINYRDEYEVEDSMNILIAGTVCQGKGQYLVVEAAKKMIEKGLNIKLFIAGPCGDQEYLENIQHYINENKLENSVIYLGLVEDMNTLRNKMHIGIIASSLEAFGRVTIEGMLSGLIMIGANTGGTAELISHKKTGFLYEHGALDSLVYQVEYVYNNFHMLSNIRGNAYNYALEFTQGKCSESILHIIKRSMV